MAEEDLVEVKFRLFDGSDIGPSKYDQSTTVASLKESILSRWPQDKEISPKTINDLKLINAGRILENNRTLAESRVSVGEFSGGVITMHVVVRPPQLDKNNEKQLLKDPKQNRFLWSIAGAMENRLGALRDQGGAHWSILEWIGAEKISGETSRRI